MVGFEDRDKIYKEKADLKARETIAKLRKQEQETFKEDVYPYNLSHFGQFDETRFSVMDLACIDLLFTDLLTSREEYCVCKYFKEYKTLEEIGKELNISKERIRQILRKAVLKIRHKLYRLDLERQIEKENEIKEKSQKARDLDLMQHRQEIAQKFLASGNYDSECVIEFGEISLKNHLGNNQYKDTSIDDLDLSVRSYNCLRRAGIFNLSELLEKTEWEMMKVKNLSRKSLKEIENKLRDLGLSFREE